MNVFITGGTGFVGRHLTRSLLDRGFHVTITGRSAGKGNNQPERLTRIACDTTVKGDWQKHLAKMDVVINLAGRNIFTRWNEDKKREIEQSRFMTTDHLVEGMAGGAVRVFLSTSASGFYGDRGDETLMEGAEGGQGFLADVCRSWEQKALAAESMGIRTVLMRFGMVLGPDGGAFPMMRTPFSLGLGGALGSGRQWMSFIHIDDLVSAILYLIEQEEARGPVNFCAPHSVTNGDFTRAMGKAFHRPAFFCIPGFVLRMVMGELGDVVLASQRMASGELTRLGFPFKYPDIDAALCDLVGRREKA
jgi:hypothetical protein